MSARVGSPSTRRAWIEMSRSLNTYLCPSVALHPEGVDRNKMTSITAGVMRESPSTRRAWIEMSILPSLSANEIVVALHPEGVDRNAFLSGRPTRALVALHPEGVDRNDIFLGKL